MSMRLKDEAAIVAATASKLGTADVGSATQPIYLNDGVATATTYTLAKSVPSNAVFTDTTYSAATTSAAGLMSASDKSKLDGITSSADSVSFSQSLTSGTKVGTITINGTGTDLYCQTNTNTTYSAGGGLSLSGTTFSHGDTSTLEGSYGPTANVTGSNGSTINVPQITVDEYGHVTAVTNRVYTSVNTYTNTTYSAGTGISLSGTTFNHSNSVTAATAGTSSATSGSTLAVPYVTYDAQGHITGSGTHTHTISGFLTSETYKGTVTSVTLTSGTGITVSSSGTAITSSGSRTITLNTATASTIGGMKASNVLSSAVTLTSSNGSTASRYYGVQVDSAGLAFVNVPWTNTNTTYSAGTGLTLSSTTFSLTSGVLATGTADTQYGPTAAVSGANGNTIAVPYLKVDTYGRVTAVGSYTYTSVNTDNNTTYSAGTGISLSGTTFSLASGVVTAGSAGPTAAVSGTNGTTVAIPRITVDTYGRVTALTSYNYTSVNTDTNTTYSVATASANGLMAAADKSLSNFMQNVTTATTLASLNVSYSTIYATLSAATSISLSGTLTTGRSMTVFCYPSASFTQAIPNSGSYISMDGDSLSVTSGKWFEINIYAYASGKYSISCKTQA